MQLNLEIYPRVTSILTGENTLVNFMHKNQHIECSSLKNDRKEEERKGGGRRKGRKEEEKKGGRKEGRKEIIEGGKKRLMGSTKKK